MLHKTLLLGVLATVLATAPAPPTASLAPAVAASAVAAPPLMEITKGEQAIRLDSVQVSADVRGGLAQTTVRMVFFNPNRRPLEGKLKFPLRDGQDVTGFALDIDGVLRAAVPVDKAKGRQVFEDVERRGVDPALLEKTQGNNFQLRVYPIAAMGRRTVEVTYSEALPKVGSDWSYRLPLAYAAGVPDLNLRVRADGGDGAPRANEALGTLDFKRRGGGYEAVLVGKQFVPTGELVLTLPAKTAPQVFTQAWDGDTYFIADVPVSETRVPRALPKAVGLLWDSSGSGATRATAAELATLEAYFAAIGDGEVQLTRLRDRAEPMVRYPIKGGDWSALRRALEATVYDGASALGDWRPDPGVGEYVLVSDGLSNYGATAFPALAPGQRLYALDSAASADSARLRALAARTGGRRIAVTAATVPAAAQALLTEGTHVDAIRGDGATDLDVESIDAERGMLRVVGRLLAPNATVVLALSGAGQRREIKLSVDGQSPDHPLAARRWATTRLAALESDPELHRAQIRRLGQGFGIVTTETSLLVLDTVEDYVRYDIAPPAPLQARFDVLKAQAQAKKKTSRDEHLKGIAAQFDTKIAWWEKAWPKGAPPPAAKPERGTAVMALSAPPPPAPSTMRDRSQSSDAPTELAAVEAQRGTINAIDVSSVESTTILTAEQIANIPVARNVTSVALLAPGTVRSASPEQGGGSAIGITLKKWSADAPYIARMKAAKADQLYAIYLDEKPAYLASSAFYLDVADYLFEAGQRDLALRVLSNLAEMDLENRQVLRILGYRLMQADAAALAVPVFGKVLWLAEEEPQSFRDLALAEAATGHAQAAIDHLYDVVQRPWDGRFAEIELIALAELNAIVARGGGKLDTSAMDSRFLRNLPLDLRVVLTWDADNSDMDLWVTDPNGEKCFYSHKETYQGGRMSDDFTGGYGPEEFSLRTAKPGKYTVEVNYYGDRQQVVAGATTLQLQFTTGFGTAKTKDQRVTLRLRDDKETVLVGEFTVDP